MASPHPTAVATRWRFATPLLLISLSLCVGAVVPTMFGAGEPDHNHAGITIEQAAEILKTSLDAELRSGALFALDVRVRHAIAALRREVEHGSEDAATLLAQWHTLLHE